MRNKDTLFPFKGSAIQCVPFLLALSIFSGNIYSQTESDAAFSQEKSEYKLGFKYLLVYSAEEKFCQHMLKRYNEDIQQGGELKPEDHPEYVQITWSSDNQILDSANIPLSERSRQNRTAVFDINNDGANEIIRIYEALPMGGGVITYGA